MSCWKTSPNIFGVRKFFRVEMQSPGSGKFYEWVDNSMCTGDIQDAARVSFEYPMENSLQ